MACVTKSFDTEAAAPGAGGTISEDEALNMFCGLCWKESKKQVERRMKKKLAWNKLEPYNNGYEVENGCFRKCLGYVCCAPLCCVGCVGLFQYTHCGLHARLLEMTGDLSKEEYDWNIYKALSKCGYACMWVPGHVLQTTFCSCCFESDKPGHPADPIGYGFKEQRVANGVAKYIYEETCPKIPNPCDGEDDCGDCLDDCGECCCEDFPLCKVIQVCRGKTPRIGCCCILRLCG